MARLSRLSLILMVVMISSTFSACKTEIKKAVQPPDVTVAKPLKKEVTRYLEYTGTIAALETVEIRARVPGFLEKINFQPRAKVKTGDSLFVIDPRQYEAALQLAQARLDSAKASSRLAQTELQMAQQLESKEAISVLRLDKKAAERDKSRADVQMAEADVVQAKLNVEWTQVTSPINGTVSRNMVDAGNLVGEIEKTLLTTVIDDESVYVYFDVSELDLLSVMRVHPSVSNETETSYEKIPAFLGLADEKDYPHKGHIDFIETRVNPSTGTIQCRAIFSNSNRILMPGLFVRIRVPVSTTMALLVPEVAVQYDQGGSRVLVVRKDSSVEARRIKVGRSVENLVVVTEGLTGDEDIVIKGLQKARPGTKVNPITSPEEEVSQSVTGQNK